MSLVKIGNNNGYLRVQLPAKYSLELYGVKQKYFSVGLKADCPNNQLKALGIASHMSDDLIRNCFDKTLGRYGLSKKLVAINEHLVNPVLSLQEVCQEFFDSQELKLKPKSIAYNKMILKVILKCPVTSLDKPLAVKDWLINHTTVGMLRRILEKISQAIEWGLKRNLIVGNNHFQGLAQELPKLNYVDYPEPNALTNSEVELIFEALKSHPQYSHYIPFVKFLLLTGCRPSEAIGLRWKNFDYDKITFEESLQKINGKWVVSKGSKNNKSRVFPCNEELKLLIDNACLNTLITYSDNECLVFLSPEKRPIDYNNFSKRCWKFVNKVIERDTTPYSCRDTFISNQIKLGVPIAVVAKWVDNSTTMIEKYYLSENIVSEILPR